MKITADYNKKYLVTYSIRVEMLEGAYYMKDGDAICYYRGGELSREHFENIDTYECYEKHQVVDYKEMQE